MKILKFLKLNLNPFSDILERKYILNISRTWCAKWHSIEYFWQDIGHLRLVLKPITEIDAQNILKTSQKLLRIKLKIIYALQPSWSKWENMHAVGTKICVIFYVSWPGSPDFRYSPALSTLPLVFPSGSHLFLQLCSWLRWPTIVNATTNLKF